MRFSTKMSLAVTVLLAVALSVGGTILVRQNFSDGLAATTEQNIGQHLFEKYSLENELLEAVATAEGITDVMLVKYGATLESYLGENRKMVAFFDDDYNEVYTNFSADIPKTGRIGVLKQDADTYTLARYGERVYMLMASHVEQPRRNIWLLNAYDITHLFLQRDQQLANLWRISGVVLALAVVVVVILSRLLTRPIRRLNRVSRRIADGAYSVRTGVRTSDEIGQLAKSFDEMAEAVEERVEQLSQSVHQRDDFVSAFTHELKTPMTSIIGYSDILRSMEADPDTRHRAANHIYHEARRLEQLSQKLLSLMRLSETDIVLAPAPVEAILAATHRSLLPLPENITLELPDAEGISVAADRDLAVDLLRNLILNAIKAQPKDGTVRVLLRTVEGRCQVMVYDTGCGIPAEELERITEPFYMVDKSRARAQGGTGIGLALCQQIAQMHGTSLRFKSKLGEGTAVTVSFALWEGDKDAV